MSQRSRPRPRTKSQSRPSSLAAISCVILSSSDALVVPMHNCKSSHIAGRSCYGHLRIPPRPSSSSSSSSSSRNAMPPGHRHTAHRCRRRRSRPSRAAAAAAAAMPRGLLSKIIDAEVVPDDDDEEEDDVMDIPPVDSSSSSTSTMMDLIEYSQNLDPDWKDMPVAFCDVTSNTYVDCNLAFYVRDPENDGIGGAEYALGVPCDVPIVVALELEDDEDETGEGGGGGATTTTTLVDGKGIVNLSKVVPINPDDEHDAGYMVEEEKEGIFQMAARALIGEYGQSIRLKRTPRVLTLEGDLDALLGDWREVLLGGGGGGKKKTRDRAGNDGGGSGKKGVDGAALSLEDALNVYDDDDDDDDDNNDGDYFDKIMRRDLGDDYESLVDGDDDDDDDIDEDLLRLFGDHSSLCVGRRRHLDDINDKEARIVDGGYDELVRKLQPSAALKLINFLGPGGKEYTILRPLRPILLVGREDPDDYTRRILLTEEERDRILPRLESACRDGLEEAGFFLSGS
ncbi:hypothetical protein ACHAXA_006315 [Cyclostephanos tholiformis]|uniref:Uncharacterized protein n=1 Tax=Cyclostephanos tholiformis TaxID=382380 RepID=A0ABD3R5G7_9STRA